MFTWICPKCGTEVPPAYSDCPNCNPKPAAPPPPATADAPRNPIPAPDPPPLSATQAFGAPPPQPPAEAQQRAVDPIRAAFQALPPPQPPAKKATLPGWAVMLLATAGLGLALFVLYVYVLPGSRSSTVASPEPKQAAPAAALTGAAPQANPFLKHLEVAGLRITEPKPQLVRIQFVVINHSAAELPEMKGTLNLRTQKGDSVFQFGFNLPSLGPYESRDLSSEVKSQLRAYELPDWQILRPELVLPVE